MQRHDDSAGDHVPVMVRAANLLAGQYHVASDRQLRNVGVSRQRQRTLIRTGVWRQHAPGVVATAAEATSWLQRAMAATLAPGTPVSLDGACAARCRGLDGFDDVDRIVVIARHGGRVHVPPDVTVNRSRVIAAEDVDAVGPIRVVSLPVTLIHLCTYGLSKRAQAFDSALRGGADPGELRSVFERWRRRGLHGPAEALALLDERVGKRLPRSWFQRLAARLLDEHGIETEDELPIFDDSGRLLAELDLAVMGWKVAVECQSWEHHGSLAAQHRDGERKRMLRRLGWDVVEVWWNDLDHPERAVADVLLALDLARRLGARR